MKNPAQASEKNSPVCPVDHPTCTLPQRIVELRQKLHQDELTELVNFRGFRLHIERELDRSQRQQTPVSLLMIDIDHFKRINDRHGHDLGNLALQHLALQLRNNLRQLDVPCRFGGEEFALILPATDLPNACRVAERLRQAVEKNHFVHQGTQIPFTISLGISTSLPREPRTIEELLKEADSYLYNAKEGGRNRVCHAELLPADTSGVSSKERQALFATTPKNNNSNKPG